MPTRALITGITGQDGSYLAELLLDKGYEVHGLVRPATDLGTSRLAHLVTDPALLDRRLHLHRGDVDDPASLRAAFERSAPDEIYHLASQTNVALSFDQIEASCQTTGMGTLRLLDLVRKSPRPPRLFHASTSEIFGRPDHAPQDEQTPARPVTPYGCAKTFATHLVGVYRRSFSLHLVNGILFNHESPRRGPTFVTQKICRAAAAIKQGRQAELVLGALTPQRDWGDARDYVRGMWQALQHPVAEDFVFATGELHTVQEVVETAFSVVELDYRKYLKQDPRFMRPEEPARLVGNPAKAERLLGWQRTTPFRQLISEMTQAALALR
jgi:GDPmannose 4,6-dehydratase